MLAKQLAAIDTTTFIPHFIQDSRLNTKRYGIDTLGAGDLQYRKGKFHCTRCIPRVGVSFLFCPAAWSFS
ncbi:hypothetical protein HUU42_03690, partial [bacterium]|nr:hypothetical protein [bacterium]